MRDLTLTIRCHIKSSFSCQTSVGRVQEEIVCDTLGSAELKELSMNYTSIFRLFSKLFQWGAVLSAQL